MKVSACVICGYLSPWVSHLALYIVYQNGRRHSAEANGNQCAEHLLQWGHLPQTLRSEYPAIGPVWRSFHQLVFLTISSTKTGQLYGFVQYSINGFFFYNSTNLKV